VIHIRGVSGLPTATIADSSRLTIGQPVVALGNALGQGGAPQVTSGTVIGLDRSIFASTDGGRGEQLTGLIESNAPISPGDSGGPLVSSDGQVVGMITAGSSQGPRDATSTDGYAIPSSTTLEVANRIRSGQASDGVILGQPGYLGVAVGDLDAGTASRLGLSAGSGALVEGVAAGSPAARAGIARDAVITAIDGNAVGSSSDLGPAIQTRKPGQQLRVTWLDQTGQHTATVTLAPGPAA
jgi:S1-C subfamily serine protease